MANRVSSKLSVAQKAALAGAAAAALVMPIAVGVINAPAVRAQSPQAARGRRPKFEVASIRRCTPESLPPPPPTADGGRGGGGDGGGNPFGDAGLFRMPCTPLRRLIETAYVQFANGQIQEDLQLKREPIQGAPDWVGSERYTVEAKPESPQKFATMAGPMLQALLEDRFKLKVHRGSKEVPVYLLVVAKGGPKFRATKEGECTSFDPTPGPPAPPEPGKPQPCSFIADPDGTNAEGATIRSLCDILSTELGRPVIDKTGLTGLFSYHLDLVVGPPGPANDDSISAAMEALPKLGLRVKSAKGNAELIVVDHVERPSGN